MTALIDRDGAPSHDEVEDDRISLLRDLELLDSDPEPEFDWLTSRAAETCGTPIALVTALDQDRQWFKSRIGLDLAETPRSWAFCELAFAAGGPLVIGDTALDPRFGRNPAVTEHGIRFYAGVAVRVEGRAIGALCVLDVQPRTLGAEQLEELAHLARQAECLLELRHRQRRDQRRLRLVEDAEERAASERRMLESYFRFLPGMVFACDALPPHELQYVSEGSRRLTGRGPADLVGGHPAGLLDLVLEDDRQLVLDAHRRVLDTGEPTDLRYRVRSADGGACWVWEQSQRSADGTRFKGLLVDVTAQVEAQRLLAESEQRYRPLVEAAPDPILTSSGGIISYANRATATLFGVERDDLVGRQLLDFVHPDDRHRANRAARATERDGDHVGPRRYRVVAADGGVVEVEVRSVAIQLGGRPATQTVVRDVSWRVREERMRDALRDVFRAIAHGADLGQTLTRLESIARDRFPGLECSISLGGDADVVRTGSSRSWPVVDREGRVLAHVALRGPTGAVALAAGSDAVTELQHVTAVAIDHAEAISLVQASAGDVAGGSSPRKVLRDLEARLGSRPADALVGVACIGVDDFAVVMQTLGYDSAQALLREVAVRVEACASERDLLTSISGERLVLCRTMRARADLEEMATAVCSAFAAPFTSGGRELFLHASIGIADSAGCDDADQLLTRSSTAMWNARDSGGNRFRWYDDDLRRRAARRLEVEVALRHAVDRGELTVSYQPKVRLADGVVIGAEALVRWSSPTLGDVEPSEFISIAEASGVIAALGRQVLRTACRDAAQWRTEQPEAAATVAVNVAAQQLHEPGFAEQVRVALADTGLDPAALCLELTETSVMRDVAASTTVLRDLKALGVRLSIDDFGTGYSSLAYLKEFPIDQLKVDRTFVADLERDPSDRHIVAAIVAIAEALGLEVVAEGVETEAQLHGLVQLGCTVAQGHLWARALPAEEVGAVMGTTVPVPTPSATGSRRSSASEELGGEGTEDALALISHELGTSLTVLTGYGELLALGRVDPKEGGEVIHRMSRRLAASLASLRDARALSSGSIELDRAEVDLADVVEAVLSDLPTAERETIQVVPGAGRVAVHGDATRLGMVISNLVHNALRFHRGSEPVEVSLGGTDGTAWLTVADRGPGVPDAGTGVIFRKFGRVHNGQGSNSGLGLFLARGIARAHGGDVRYAHRDGGGASFSLQLPVADA